MLPFSLSLSQRSRLLHSSKPPPNPRNTYPYFTNLELESLSPRPPQNSPRRLPPSLSQLLPPHRYSLDLNRAPTRSTPPHPCPHCSLSHLSCFNPRRFVPRIKLYTHDTQLHNHLGLDPSSHPHPSLQPPSHSTPLHSTPLHGSNPAPVPEALHWSPTDVTNWLRSLRLGHLSPAFQRNNVCGRVLLSLTPDAVKYRLGVHDDKDLDHFFHSLRQLHHRLQGTRRTPFFAAIHALSNSSDPPHESRLDLTLNLLHSPTTSLYAKEHALSHLIHRYLSQRDSKRLLQLANSVYSEGFIMPSPSNYDDLISSLLSIHAHDQALLVTKAACALDVKLHPRVFSSLISIHLHTLLHPYGAIELFELSRAFCASASLDISVLAISAYLAINAEFDALSILNAELASSPDIRLLEPLFSFYARLNRESNFKKMLQLAKKHKLALSDKANAALVALHASRGRFNYVRQIVSKIHVGPYSHISQLCGYLLHDLVDLAAPLLRQLESVQLYPHPELLDYLLLRCSSARTAHLVFHHFLSVDHFSLTVQNALHLHRVLIDLGHLHSSLLVDLQLSQHPTHSWISRSPHYYRSLLTELSAQLHHPSIASDARRWLDSSFSDQHFDPHRWADNWTLVRSDWLQLTRSTRDRDDPPIDD